jgi:hypothetical protein
MTTTPIIIEEGRVTIQSASGTWMTQHQIADLFGVFVSAVGSNIRSILNSEVLRENEVCRHKTTKDGSIMTLYSLEIITALAFRLKSQKAEQFRRWIVAQAVNPVILWKLPGINAMLN